MTLCYGSGNFTVMTVVGSPEGGLKKGPPPTTVTCHDHSTSILKVQEARAYVKCLVRIPTEKYVI